MLLSGDECGRSQNGNNNAYCQDNEISWLNWDDRDEALLTFTRKLIRFTRKHPTFLRRKWFQGIPIKGKDVTDISWFLPEGTEMSDEHWAETFAKSLGVFLHGEGIHSLDMKGDKIYDDSFYLMFNGHFEPVDFILPEKKWGEKWFKILDTSIEEGFIEEKSPEYSAGDSVVVDARSVVLLRLPIRRETDVQH
jgi:glycogen operon protein